MRVHTRMNRVDVCCMNIRGVATTYCFFLLYGRFFSFFGRRAPFSSMFLCWEWGCFFFFFCTYFLKNEKKNVFLYHTIFIYQLKKKRRPCFFSKKKERSVDLIDSFSHLMYLHNACVFQGGRFFFLIFSNKKSRCVRSEKSGRSDSSGWPPWLWWGTAR